MAKDCEVKKKGAERGNVQNIKFNQTMKEENFTYCSSHFFFLCKVCQNLHLDLNMQLTISQS